MRISDWSSDVCSSDLGDKIRHPRFSRIRLGFRDPLGVDVYPDGPNAMSARCRDRDTAIARTQIIENVPLLDVRHLEHGIDHRLRGGHSNHVWISFRLRISEEQQSEVQSTIRNFN